MRKLLILLAAAALVVGSAMVMPVMAQDGAVSISGNSHIETFWNDRDDTLVKYTSGVPTASSDTDLMFDLQAVTTNLNFDFKQGDISGHVGLRYFAGSQTDSWWGQWDFGSGALRIGNINNPAWHPFSSLSVRVANSPWYGAVDAVKTSDSIQLIFPAGPGTLTVAAIMPATYAAGTVVSAAAVTGTARVATTDVDKVIPKLEAGYNFKVAGASIWVGGGYQTLKEVVVATDKEYDINSYLAGIYGSYGFGPVTVNGNFWYMQNPAAYGDSGNPAPFNSWGTPTLTVATAYDSVTDDIQDVSLWGWHVSAGFKINDMLTLQGGYGMNHWERDKVSAASPLAELQDPEDERAMYYVNMPIFVAKNFTLTPEIGVYDEKDTKLATTTTTTDQGKTTYWGAKWLIRF